MYLFAVDLHAIKPRLVHAELANPAPSDPRDECRHASVQKAKSYNTDFTSPTTPDIEQSANRPRTTER